MDVNFSFVGGMKILSLLNATSNPLVHIKIEKYEFNLNFAHACAICNKIFLDFKKTNNIKKEYEFICDIDDERTHEMFQLYISGVDKFSNVPETVLRDFYRIGCSIDNNDMRMQYILKCIRQEITLDNVEDFSEHVVFLSSEDSVYNKFVDYVSSHIIDISLDVLFKFVSVHGYDFFERIITKSQNSTKKDDFIISMIEKDIKYSRFANNIELSNDLQNYISRISSVIESTSEKDSERECLISFLTTNYIKSTKKLSEQQNQIISLNKVISQQQKIVDLENKVNSLQDHVDNKKQELQSIPEVLDESVSLEQALHNLEQKIADKLRKNDEIDKWNTELMVAISYKQKELDGIPEVEDITEDLQNQFTALKMAIADRNATNYEIVSKNKELSDLVSEMQLELDSIPVIEDKSTELVSKLKELISQIEQNH